MNDVRNVYGIGLKKANELRQYYNIRTVDTLRKYVRKIPGIITDTQRDSLKYHNKVSNYISYADADKHAKYITKNIPDAIITGQYRRKEKKIYEISVITTSNLKNNIDKLISKKYIIAVLSMGEEKFSGIVKIPGTSNYRRIDILKTTSAEKPFALLYLTGDFVQNIIMRQKAKKMKYSLSHCGLKNIKTGKMVKNIKSENDIFDFLKIPYVPPHERTHKGNEKKILLKLK